MADSNDKPDKILVPNDRIFSRGQGCWNCKHKESANKFWSDKRQKDLEEAVRIAAASDLGENDPKVINIRNMVDLADHAVAAGALVRCSTKNPRAKTALGADVGDLVVHNYLCNSWSAAQGASIARAGGKADDLPEELIDKLDGPDGQRKN